MPKYAITQIGVAIGLSIVLFLLIYTISMIFLLAVASAIGFFIFYILLVIFVENKDDIFTITLIKNAKKRKTFRRKDTNIKLKQSGQQLLPLKDDINSEN